MKEIISNWKLNKASLEAKWLLPFTSLLTPYLIFLSANNYALNTRAPWIIGTGIILVALIVAMLSMVGGNLLGNLLTAAIITFFLDIQLGWISGELDFCLSFLAIIFLAWALKNNFYIITNTLFVAFLSVTLIQILVQNPGTSSEVMPESTSLDGRYPHRIIHLVLDEHIGIDGIPLGNEAGRAIKEKILEFYNRYGFYVFGKSYSHYGETLDSIPNMVNYTDASLSKSLVRKNVGGGSWALLNNKYFDDLHSLGYRINVWESKFLLFCSENKQNIDICNQYNHWDTNVMQDFDLFLSDQVNILFVAYIKRSKMYSMTRWYYKQLKAIAMQHGAVLPEWPRDRLPATTALNSLKTLDNVWQDILSLPTGNFLFAHLMFPHRPLMANPDCSIRKNIDTWYDFDRPIPREEKYQLYFDQLECLYTRLESLFEKMKAGNIWRDSMIILHGDHGSRLSSTVPAVSTKDELTGKDLSDYYSTLFAVKLPGMNSTYNPERFPINELLKAIVLKFGGSDEPFSVTPSTPFVYLPAEGADNQLTAIPYTTAE